MDTCDLNFLCEVVQELVEAGLAPSLKNITLSLSPKGRERAVVEALERLVSDGRLVKSAAVLQFDGDEDTADLALYHPYLPS